MSLPAADPVYICERHGLEHRRADGSPVCCTGHSKRSPHKCCKRAPAAGQRVCKLHGAASPQAQAGARRRLAEAEALASLAEVGVVPIGDPVDELLELAAKAKAWMDHMANHVAELGRDYRFADRDSFGRATEQLDARVAVLERAMDRLHRVLVDINKLGLEERRVRLDEIRAGLVAAVLVGVLRELGHDPEAEAVLAVLDRWLPVLDGQPAPVIDVAEAS